MPVLQFKGKTAVETYHHTLPHHVLEFDPKLSLLAKGEKPTLDGNLILEGDNLLGLKALLPTHAGRVKCIYIDPPYNTGKEGWVYNDNLTQPQFKEWIGQIVGSESEDATRHDKWCCMMYPRLQLLKQLLTDDGVIFVSIDDNEIENLLHLMSEVLGRENWIATIVWKGATDNNPTLVAIEHEYIVCWARNRSALPKAWTEANPEAKQFMLAAYQEIASQTHDQAELQRRFRSFIKENRERCGRLSHYDRIDETGPFTGSREVHNPGREGYRYDVLHPGTMKPCKEPARGYRYPPSRMKELIDSGRIIYGADESQIIQIKEYLQDYQGSLKSVVSLDSRVGANALADIFGSREVFKGPKPVTLLQSLLSFCTGPDDVILDSFAGSGTTAHAVLELNREAGGNRRFILIQIPFETKDQHQQGLNICSSVTAERVRRVMCGYSRHNNGRDGSRRRPELIPGLGGTFTYARLGPPLFGEYRTFAVEHPSFEELAKYIIYTETSREFDPKAVDVKSGKIGEHAHTGYYLLYTPDAKSDRQLDLPLLRRIVEQDKNPNLVIYCEKLWLHREDLEKLEADTRRHVRPMVIPFNLK